ncbi:spermidine coumaroyl-CoA acyltransferase [Ziziphus jujuba]|uniref:Spermidine coumaroyl-CoA acyltransferase n=1 Tax=Ziziphus jujuba TaxID=326968 RepID=A0A6P3Z9K0_ZIZJJ|nr:spermidine coumaroyl-CoA acyltransferase [Ziziphus jujuba]
METTHQTPSFLVIRKDVELVKPSKPTPSEILSLSTLDNNPPLERYTHVVYAYRAKSNSSNHVNHNNHVHDHVASNFVADKLLEPACMIKEALSKALVYYYPLAGKLRRDSNGDLRITCNAAGVPFLVAEADCQLSSLRYLDGIGIETLKQLVSDFQSYDVDSDGYHPIGLQVTKFSCGGLTIGLCLSHSICDGPGTGQFLKAMSEFTMGKMEPTLKPVWDRERLTGKTIEAVPLNSTEGEAFSSATSPYLPTSELLHDCAYLTSESIKRLKMKLMKEIVDSNEVPSESFTTVEVLGGFIWRARARALNLNPDGKTLFVLTMGIRNHFVPPLPDGYYGNAFIGSNVVVMGKDLNEQPLSKTVQLIKQSKKTAFQNDYIRHSIDVTETTRKQNKKIESTCPNTVFTDWRHLGLLEIGFGSWEAVNIEPIPWNMSGHVDLCLLMPPAKLDPAMEGGARILVSLPRPAMAKFKEEIDSLKVEDDD